MKPYIEQTKNDTCWFVATITSLILGKKSQLFSKKILSKPIKGDEDQLLKTIRKALIDCMNQKCLSDRDYINMLNKYDKKYFTKYSQHYAYILPLLKYIYLLEENEYIYFVVMYDNQKTYSLFYLNGVFTYKQSLQKNFDQKFLNPLYQTNDKKQLNKYIEEFLKKSNYKIVILQKLQMLKNDYNLPEKISKYHLDSVMVGYGKPYNKTGHIVSVRKIGSQKWIVQNLCNCDQQKEYNVNKKFLEQSVQIQQVIPDKYAKAFNRLNHSEPKSSHTGLYFPSSKSF